MAVLFLVSSWSAGGRKEREIPAARAGGGSGLRNMEGKEVRFGIFSSALFATVDHGRLLRCGERDARFLYAAGGLSR